MSMDMNPAVPTDLWSRGQHTGLSLVYLVQRGATKLSPNVGIELPKSVRYPHADMCTVMHEHHAQVLKFIQLARADKEKVPSTQGL